MSYTNFGEFLRILRIQNHEVMGDTAKLLGVSTPFMSAVENGKKNIPDGWFEIIADHYNLSEFDRTRLQNAIDSSKTQLRINMTEADNFKRQMAVQFQRSFHDMDDDTAKKIMSLLNNTGGDQ